MCYVLCHNHPVIPAGAPAAKAGIQAALFHPNFEAGKPVTMIWIPDQVGDERKGV